MKNIKQAHDVEISSDAITILELKRGLKNNITFGLVGIFIELITLGLKGSN